MKEILPNKYRASFFERFNKYVLKSNNCWGWNGTKSSTGYPVISLGRKQSHNRVSRIVLNEKEAIPFVTACALHKCDNPGCVNPDHLFWGSKKDNTQDMISKNRGHKPPVIYRDDSKRCVLKTYHIPIIKEQAKTMSLKSLSQYYGVCYETMNRFTVKNNIKTINMRGVMVKPPRKLSKFEDIKVENKLIELSKTMTVTQLSIFFSCKRDTIYTQLKRLDKKAVHGRPKKKFLV